ncbi:hypothetical protein ABZV29_39260 [Streptomyces sp. NPDC005236]|uniref:hypothetical protein n=1 Tax=Streptomyces sp. NPDC005236 TaxID=3157028 RepID=UPI0033A2D6EE
MSQCTVTTKRGTRCRYALMVWHGVGPHPQVCERHATPEQKAASTAALDVPVNIATADPAAVFPMVSITPQRVISDSPIGWVAKIRGTNTKYVYARTFLNRSGPPYGWPLTGNGLYECRGIGAQGMFSGFFVVKGAFRSRVELVTPERAAQLARKLGSKPAER